MSYLKKRMFSVSCLQNKICSKENSLILKRPAVFIDFFNEDKYALSFLKDLCFFCKEIIVRAVKVFVRLLFVCLFFVVCSVAATGKSEHFLLELIESFKSVHLWFI